MRSGILSIQILRRNIVPQFKFRTYASSTKGTVCTGPPSKGPKCAGYTARTCDAHMNELPIPCGPWDTHYKGRQRFYTQWLFVGVAWFTLAAVVMIKTGSFYLNWAPPDYPAPPSEMIEECVD